MVGYQGPQDGSVPPEILSKRQEFHQSKAAIFSFLDTAALDIEELKDEDGIDQRLTHCVDNIIQELMYVLPYSKAMNCLANATKDLSGSRDQPQDVVDELDFFGEVQRISEEFIAEIQRQSVERVTDEVRMQQVREEQEKMNEIILKQLQQQEEMLKQKYGGNIPAELNVLQFHKMQQE